MANCRITMTTKGMKKARLLEYNTNPCQHKIYLKIAVMLTRLALESTPTGGKQPSSLMLSSVTRKLAKPGASMCIGREMTSAINQAPSIIRVVGRRFLLATISAYLHVSILLLLSSHNPSLHAVNISIFPCWRFIFVLNHPWLKSI